MTINREYFVDVFGGIVDAVRQEYDTVNNPKETPYYYYGHLRDIVDVLRQKSENGEQKYPAICLIQDFKETGQNHRIEYIVNPTILIIGITNENFNAAGRYTNVFKTTLYPLRELLIKQISKSTDLWRLPVERIDYDKTDRVYWGKESLYGSDGNIFNDPIDAIEYTFKNDTIKVKKQKNC